MKSITDTIAELQAKSKVRRSSVPVESGEIPKAKKGNVAAPNALFRSSLFPALNNNGERKQLENVKLFSVGGLNVNFTGKQFDQTDLDVYLEVLNIAKDKEIGDKIEFTAYGLLKSLGIAISGDRYKWLYDALFRLKAGVIVIEDHNKKYVGNLIDDFTRDEPTNHYIIRLNPNFAVLFDKGMWSGINKSQRKAIGRNQTAKSLHAYYSTHTNPAPHKIETLAKIAGLENKNKYMIPNTIIRAHEVLCSEKVSFLESYDVNDNKIQAKIKDK